MKEKKAKNTTKWTINHTLVTIGSILIIIGVHFIIQINMDKKTIKELTIDKTKIEKQLSDYDDQLNNIYKQTDTLSKEKLFLLKNESLNLKKELHHFEIEKEKIIEGLFMEHTKYWAFIIAIFTLIIVFSGLEFNINEKVNSIIAKTIKTKKKDIENIVDDKTWEFRLLSKSNIIIANPNKKDDDGTLDTIVKFFGENDVNSHYTLNNVSFENPDDIINKARNYLKEDFLNILLLENSDGKWKVNEEGNIENARKIAIKISKMEKNIMLLYYGPGDAGNFPSRKSDYENNEDPYNIIKKIAYANAPYSLYANLLDTLKFMDINDEKFNA